MARIKEQWMKQKEEESDLDLSYADWCRENPGEPTTSALNKMEADCNKSTAVSNRILTHWPDYDPNTGTGA